MENQTEMETAIDEGIRQGSYPLKGYVFLGGPFFLLANKVLHRNPDHKKR